MTGIWSEEDDMKLWLLRTKPLSQLSRTFNKTAGAVRSRLIHLQDPTHKAYQRLVKNGCHVSQPSGHEYTHYKPTRQYRTKMAICRRCHVK